ncbi:prevent-host-death family protein [Streptomyces ambofaciens]
MPEGCGRVGVPEGDQALPGGLGAEPGLAGRELGDGVEQRPVEDLLVQPADHRGVPFPGAQQPGDRVGAQAQGAAETAQVGLVLGHQVGAAQPVQLDAVLHGAQKPVRLVELGGVGAADVAARGEGRQRVQRGAAVQGGVRPPVHQLEELHGELDVPEAAGPELELPVDLGDGDVLHHPAAHLLHVRDEVLAVGGLPHQGLEGGDVLGAEPGVAGHRAGLEQRLELPGLGPALVVGDVAAEGAHQGAVAALGAEVGVDGPDGALDGGLGADPHHVRGQRGGGAQRLGLVDVRAFGGLAHEDDVDVGDVVQLVSAALAHRDHRQPAPRGVLGGGVLGEGQGGAQGGGGEVGQFGGGLGDVDGAAHVPGGDGQQAAPVGDAQGDRVGGLGEPPLELLDPAVQVARLVGDEGLPVPRVPGEVVGERLGGAEHTEEAVAQRLGRYQGVEQLPAGGGVGLRLQEPYQPEQGEVRVGSGAQRLQEDGVGPQLGQLGPLQQPLGGRGIGEAVPQQSREGTAPAPRRRHLGLLSDSGARGPGRIKVVRAERSRGTACGRRGVPPPAPPVPLFRWPASDSYDILYKPRKGGTGMSITASEARQNLFPLIEQVNEDHAPVHITSRKGNAVLMSEEDFTAWTETVHLLRSPRNARRLLDSIAEAEAGDARQRELIDPDAERA